MAPVLCVFILIALFTGMFAGAMVESLFLFRLYKLFVFIFIVYLFILIGVSAAFLK